MARPKKRIPSPPAFPVTTYFDNGLSSRIPVSNTGMSIEDVFAAHALQGWLAGPCQGSTLDDYDGDEKAFEEHQDAVAKACYGYARAMMRQRRS